MVTVAPTLETMAEIYQLGRSGGAKSPRFAAYRARAEHEWGLAGYNPMAGQHALDTVQQLAAFDAESLAGESALAVLEQCEFPGDVTLAIVVASPGMWTDRLATEVRHRTSASRRAGHGEILLWTGEALDAGLVLREAAAETVRVMWTTLHGAADTLGALLAREGLAYALAFNPYGPRSPLDNARVAEGITVLGDTSTLGDIVAVLYGDAAATCLGVTTLGLAEYAGYRWAIARAAAVIDLAGPGEALRRMEHRGGPF